MNLQATLKFVTLSSMVVVLAATPLMAGGPFVPNVSVPAPNFFGPGPLDLQYVVGGYGGYGASTAYSASLNGHADVLRARGTYNLMSSMAARNYEEARSRAMDNAVKAIATRQERERMGIAKQEAKRQEKKEAAARLAANRAIDNRKLEISSEQEERAASRLFLARKLVENGKTETARDWLREIVEEHAETEAAVTAGQLLAQLR